MITMKRMDFVPEKYKEYQYTMKERSPNDTQLKDSKDADLISSCELSIWEK